MPHQESTVICLFLLRLIWVSRHWIDSGWIVRMCICLHCLISYDCQAILCFWAGLTFSDRRMVLVSSKGFLCEFLGPNRNSHRAASNYYLCFQLVNVIQLPFNSKTNKKKIKTHETFQFIKDQTFMLKIRYSGRKFMDS